MKKASLLLVLFSALLFTSCTKDIIYSDEVDVHQWMQNHEWGRVALIDNYNGNYIVETSNGYSVVQAWSGATPRRGDEMYAYFSNRGVQNIYNYTGDYFLKSRVMDSWLSWQQALILLDDLSY